MSDKISQAGKYRIDGKFSMNEDGQIINTISGEPIPKDEPLFILRGRDRLAIGTIYHYLELATAAGCTNYHLNGVEKAWQEFKKFASNNPHRMKEPGNTRGSKWVGQEDDKEGR